MTRIAPTNTETVRPDMRVAEALARWPGLTRVFLKHGMACAGCAMADHMTLAEAAEVYGLDTAAFVGELRAAV